MGSLPCQVVAGMSDRCVYRLSLTLVSFVFFPSLFSRACVCFRDGALGETYLAVFETPQVCTTVRSPCT